MESEDDNEPESGPDSSNDAVDEKDDADDFLIAWEVLDTARIIYERENERNAFLKNSKLSEIHCLLGDLSMEVENFDTAVAEFQNSFEYLKKNEKGSLNIPDVRFASSIMFKKGMALEYSGKTTESVESFEFSKKLLADILNHVQGSEKEELSLLISDLDEKVT